MGDPSPFERMTAIFSSTYVEGLLFVLAVVVLVVIVGFPLIGPPRENGRCSFRNFYLYFYLKAPFRKHNCLIQMI